MCVVVNTVCVCVRFAGVTFIAARDRRQTPSTRGVQRQQQRHENASASAFSYFATRSMYTHYIMYDFGTHVTNMYYTSCGWSLASLELCPNGSVHSHQRRTTCCNNEMKFTRPKTENYKCASVRVCVRVCVCERASVYFAAILISSQFQLYTRTCECSGPTNTNTTTTSGSIHTFNKIQH